eukprot:4298680-Pyramimonas_sp.AAC.1
MAEAKKAKEREEKNKRNKIGPQVSLGQKDMSALIKETLSKEDGPKKPLTDAERRAAALAEKERRMEEAYNDALSWLEVGRGVVGATRGMLLQRTLKGDDGKPRCPLAATTLSPNPNPNPKPNNPRCLRAAVPKP